MEELSLRHTRALAELAGYDGSAHLGNQAGADCQPGSHCYEYCQNQEQSFHDNFAVEHIQPRAAGGMDALENLAFCCQGCNSRKLAATSAVDSAIRNNPALFDSRQQSWAKHSTWTDDFAQVSGLTETERARVEKLQLNRPVRSTCAGRSIWQEYIPRPVFRTHSMSATDTTERELEALIESSCSPKAAT